MSGVSVRVERLSKRYRIPRPDGPKWRDFVARPHWALVQPRSLEVLALHDVSFEVEEGEVFGIIGRNGAGKSTLLKVLARITEPTAGRVTMVGHLASLLEVGTGFHPELTGRENVYLNGMLLGMSSRQVDAAFDAICAFASIGAYINVPIKRYSSGMQLRLAFAVAAHLAADTMIIDEVLAVGDAEFQRKCLGAMRDVSRSGRTTIFVSHNMSAVESLCTRVMWLDGGRVRCIGSADAVIREYLAAAFDSAEPATARRSLTDVQRPWTLGSARCASIEFRRNPQAPPRPPWRVAFGEPFEIQLDFVLDRTLPELECGLGFRNERGEDVAASHSFDIERLQIAPGARAGNATVHVTQPWLRPGTYYLEAALMSGVQLLDHVPDAAVLVVEEQAAPTAPAIRRAAMAPEWHWDIAVTETHR